MKTQTMVFVTVMVLILIVAAYLIVKANKPATTVASASEPTANVWTVAGGLMDLFGKKDNDGGPVEEAEGFNEPGGTFGPPQA